MKRLLFAICICSLALTGCTPKEKTTVLEDNVLLNEINFSNKITKEKLDLKLDKDYIFVPGFFHDDKIYGVLSAKDDSEIYSSSYSKDTGLSKFNKLDGGFDIDSGYLQKRVIFKYDSGTKSNINIRDNTTNEVKEFPFVDFNIVNRTETRVSPSEDTGNSVQFLNLDLSQNENISYGENYQMVVSNNNFGFSSISRNIFEGESPDFKFLDGAKNTNRYKRSYNILTLYNFEKNSTIIYDGYLTPVNFPFIQKIIYDDKSNNFYAIAGFYEDELYKININDDKYTIELVYKFDLGERCIGSTFAKIIDGNLMLDTYIPKPIDKENGYTLTSRKILLFNLQDNKVIETTESNNFDTNLLPVFTLDSTKYFLINNFDTTKKESSIFLCTIIGSKIQYLYNLNTEPKCVAIDEDNKHLFVLSSNGDIDNIQYYLYNLDID